MIAQAACERAARQDQRQKNNSATVLQAHIRRYLVECSLHERLRSQFDELLSRVSNATESRSIVDAFDELLHWMVLFFSPHHDASRLTSLSSLVLKHKSLLVAQVIDSRFTSPANIKVNLTRCSFDPASVNRLFRLVRLIQFNIKQMNHIVIGCSMCRQGSSRNTKATGSMVSNDQHTKMTSNDIAIHLRMIEDFTRSSTYESSSGTDASVTQAILEYIWSHLVQHNYFATLKLVLDSRVPEPYEETMKAPTVLADALFTLVLAPLKQIYCKPATSQLVVYSLFNELLAPCNSTEDKMRTNSSSSSGSCKASFVKMTPQVQLYVLPSLASMASHLVNLSPRVLLLSIMDCDVIFTSSSSSSRENGSSEEYPIHASIKCKQMTIQFMYTLIRLISPQMSHMSLDDKSFYLYILGKLSISALIPAFTLLNSRKNKNTRPHDLNEDDDDEDVMMPMVSEDNSDLNQWSAIVSATTGLVNDVEHVNLICHLLEEPLSSSLPCHVMYSIFNLAYALLTSHHMAIFEYRLLHTLAFKSSFLRLLWSIVSSEVTTSIFSPISVPLLQILSNSLNTIATSSTTKSQWLNFIHNLTLFCRLMSYYLPTIDDVEFYSGKLPFSLTELSHIAVTMKDVTIGLIYLAYHDSKNIAVIDHETVQDWILLFKSSVTFVRQLYNRNARRPFVAIDLWISDKVIMPYLVERSSTSNSSSMINFEMASKQRRIRYSMFLGPSRLSRSQLEESGPPLSTTEIRNLTILQEVPFVVSFTDRVKILHSLMNRDKEISNTRGGVVGYHFLLPGGMIDVRIRRSYFYEDAFEKLLTEENFKKPIRVQLINDLGLEEAGVDGGGLFREFLNEFLKAAFDPNRGFFLTTEADRLIHPNPAAFTIYGNDHVKHYYFIGRMLGKALYEQMLVDLPLAPFFLAKLISLGSSVDIDMHNLATLDPTLYNNLIALKTYEACKVAELNLDFTITNSILGSTTEIELKPNGKNIPVTAANRIEYIHLIADYRLNRQTREACRAFKSGFSDVINLDWIRMFSPNELHILISGNPTPIDVDDLMAHTVYAGNYNQDHEVITIFWSVVRDLDESQRQALLKFVTSCSRPPLLGFKNLVPPFSIQSAGKEERLPTASTCMNLLKLPEYNDRQTLKNKLIYAIESAAGFELS